MTTCKSIAPTQDGSRSSSTNMNLKMRMRMKMKMERKRLKTELDTSSTGRTVKHLMFTEERMKKVEMSSSGTSITERTSNGELSMLMNLKRLSLRE